MYICNKCFIIFTRKDKYIQHISQIKPCKTINYKGIKEPKKLKNFVKNYIEEYTESLLVKDYKCEYCGRTYKTKSYYDKHKKETCIRHKEFEQNIIKHKLEKINAIKIDNDFMKKEIFNAIHTLPRYSIKNGKIISLKEKPKKTKSNLAISGLYFFDKNASDYASKLKKSNRKETEIIDLIKIYLKRKKLKHKIMGRIKSAQNA